MNKINTPIKDGGPAFPIIYCSEGVTLRDWFASHAPISEEDYPAAAAVINVFMGRPCPDRMKYAQWAQWHAEFHARVRYIKADAMLAARAKGPA